MSFFKVNPPAWDGTIVIPVYRSALSDDERLSVKQLFRVMGGRDMAVAAPEGLELPGEFQSCRAEWFEPRFFKGIDGYNSLMLSSEFYSRFRKKKDILIHQLDCLVFRDDLAKWSAKDFSYVAPPWLGKFWNDPKLGLWRVGNGGFSLRRVKDFLRILDRRMPPGTMEMAGKRALSSYVEETNPQNHYRKTATAEPRRQEAMITVEEDLVSYPLNEDLFWSFEAPLLDAGFRIPTANEALPFAFEKAPRWCYRKNWWRLPMGCHAWVKEDRQFWKRFVS